MHWISLSKASKAYSISKDRLKQMAKRGQIRGGIDPGAKVTRWRFDRRSIDAYFDSLVTRESAHERAVTLMKGGRLW